MVMATGIVSIAAHQFGMAGTADALFWLNIVAYLIIWLLTALRAARFPRELWRDMIDHQCGPGSRPLATARLLSERGWQRCA
jgi:hypothetical protein